MQGDSRIEILDKVHEHLTAVLADPESKLDADLVDRCQASLSADIPRELLLRLQGDAIAIFRVSRGDLQPLSELVIKAASFVTFDDLQLVLDLNDLIDGLRAPVPTLTFLAVVYLLKAADAPGDAAAVGSRPGLVEALVRLWLTTDATYISEKALETLVALLATDLPYHTTRINKPQEGRVGNATGQGLVWRRLLRDKEVYTLLFACCAPSSTEALSLSKLQVSNAQGRIYDFVAKVAPMYWDAIADSQIPEVERHYKSRSVLDFVANNMIDEDDLLMKVTRFDFFVKFVQFRTVSEEGCRELLSIPQQSSPALEFLIENRIHQDIFQYYLKEEEMDSITLSLMSNVHQRYIATYLKTYPEHFLQHRNMVSYVIDILNKNLNIRPAVWAHGSPPYADLWVLQAIPPIVLVDATTRNMNPLRLIPTTPANAAAFHTLATVFHSNPGEPPTGGSREGDHIRSSRAARALFLQYINQHPDFWSNVGAATNVLAMEDAAIAAINLIRAIMTAQWLQPLPESTNSATQQLSAGLDSLDLTTDPSPKTGVAAIILLGMQALFQALIVPPQPIAGSAGSDSSSVAWKIARSKFDALLDLQRMMRAGVGKDEVPDDVWQAIETNLHSRISLGPWGRTAEIGSRVQTMEE